MENLIKIRMMTGGTRISGNLHIDEHLHLHGLVLFPSYIADYLLSVFPIFCDSFSCTKSCPAATRTIIGRNTISCDAIPHQHM